MRRIALAAICALALSGCATTMEWMNPFGGKQTSVSEEQQLYLDLIRGLRERGLNRAALAHLDEFEGQYGETDGTILLRGEALSAIGEHEAAITTLRRIGSGPDLPAARQAMGLAAAGAGRWAEARDSLEEAVRLEPTNARYLNNLGYVLLQQGDTTLAEHRLRTAAELDSESAEIRNNVALLLLATGRRAEGERLLALVPEAEARNAIRREAARLAERPTRSS